MVEGVGGADGSSGGDVDSMASIVEESGANVKSAEAVRGPGGAVFLGRRWETQSWPGGWRGWALKSSLNRCRPCQADMVEVDGEWEGGDQGRRWLRVSSAMGRSRCQRSGGKVS